MKKTTKKPVRKVRLVRRAGRVKNVKKKLTRKVVRKKPKTRVPKTKIPAKLIKLLVESKIKYDIVAHKVVFTAWDLAQTLKMKPSEISKTLVLKADKDYILAVLPGDLRLDMAKLKKLAKVKKISIVSEKDMVKKFKVKPGAITPFGSLYKTPVYIENRLTKLTNCLFQSGSFNHSIKMKVKDFIKIEEPVKGSFGKKK